MIRSGATAVGKATRSDSPRGLLVVQPGEYHRRDPTREIAEDLRGVGRTVDAVVVTPEDVERDRDSCAFVTAPALRDGGCVSAT